MLALAPGLRSICIQIGVEGDSESWYTIMDEDGTVGLQEVSEERALAVLDTAT